MPIKKTNSLGIYWLRYANRKTVKYAVGLSRLGSCFTIINPNI